MPPAARAAAPTAETPNRMETGLRANSGENKSHLWTGWRGNTPVLFVEVLPALMQQCLHDGMNSGFGEAWAVADGSMPIQAL